MTTTQPNWFLAQSFRQSARTLQASDARTSFDHSSKHNKDCDSGTYNESCRGEVHFSIQGLSHSAVQEHDHIRKEAVQKLIHHFETHPNKEALKADLKQNRAFIQRAVEGNDLHHGKHGVLRDLRDQSQSTVRQLCDMLDERHCILYMRNMLATFRQSSETKQGPQRGSVDSKLRDKERPIPRSAPREHREAKNLACSSFLF